MKVDRKIFVLLGLAILLAAGSYFVHYGFWENFAIDFFFLVVVPVLFLTRGKNWKVLKKYGLALGNWKWWGKWVVVLLLVSLPIMYYGIGLPGFADYYPKYPPARYSWTAFILFELAFGVVMFATEFFYRGFLMFGLAEKMDPRIANLIHAFVYMLVHIGKPGWEVPYSFVAGYVFGYVDYKGKSILPSFIMHWVSSVIFDLMIVLFVL